jgi:hypothetical protein
MTPTVCVFNRTRETFLCLSAVAAEELRTPSPEIPGFRKVARDDGIWLMPSLGIYTVGTLVPVDLVYLDRGNRVVELVEHLDPLQIVPVRCRCASVLKVRTRTVYSSRTRVGDELLICSPEEVETHWRQIQEHSQAQRTWTKQEVIPCSNG